MSLILEALRRLCPTGRGKAIRIRRIQIFDRVSCSIPERQATRASREEQSGFLLAGAHPGIKLANSAYPILNAQKTRPRNISTAGGFRRFGSEMATVAPENPKAAGLREAKPSLR